MKIAVPKEIQDLEYRVALTPDVVKKLAKTADVHVETGAGLAAGHRDEDYVAAGAKVGDRNSVWQGADVVFKINKPQVHADGTDEVDLIPEGAVLVSLLGPMFNPKLMERIARRGVTAFSLDAIPRTSRAQSMDVLSSQANVAGYKAVLMAADKLPKLMPMLMTAAGTIAPAKVFILGAGVAGLQAIATARRLGAVVSAFDVRSAVKEQVKSLGAKFVDIDVGESGEGEGGYAKELSEAAKQRQRDELGKVAAGMDIIITTAAIPGRQAPRLIEGAAVQAMKKGSVIIDLAAATGGNVEGSKPDEEVDINGTLVLGPTNLAATMPKDASQMFAKNIQNLFEIMVDKEGKLELNWEDDILAGCVITRGGEVVHERTLLALKAEAAA